MSVDDGRRGGELRARVDTLGNLLVEGFHLIGLFAIGAATVWAGAFAFIGMVRKGGATIEDLLLLFIYLEIGAMVGIYFKTNRMPLRFLLYVAMTAVTRLLIGHVNVHHKPDWETIYAATAILILAFAVLVVRYASFNYPARGGGSDDAELTDSDRPAARPDRSS